MEISMRKKLITHKRAPRLSVRSFVRSFVLYSFSFSFSFLFPANGKLPLPSSGPGH